MPLIGGFVTFMFPMLTLCDKVTRERRTGASGEGSGLMLWQTMSTKLKKKKVE